MKSALLKNVLVKNDLLKKVLVKKDLVKKDLVKNKKQFVDLTAVEQLTLMGLVLPVLVEQHD